MERINSRIFIICTRDERMIKKYYHCLLIFFITKIYKLYCFAKYFQQISFIFLKKIIILKKIICDIINKKKLKFNIKNIVN